MERELIDKDRQLNAAPSNFTKNLLVEKDLEIGEFRITVDSLKCEKTKFEEETWKLQRDVCELKEKIETDS